MTRSIKAKGGHFEALSEEREYGAARAAKATIVVVLSLVFSFGCWAYATEMPEITRAIGEIEPIGDIRRVEHFDGGIVMSVSVKPGDAVSRGEPLATIRAPDLDANLKEARRELAALDRDASRLKSLMSLEAPAVGAADLLEETALVDRSAAELAFIRASAETLRRRVAARTRSRDAAEALRDNAATRLAIAKETLARLRLLREKDLVNEIRLEEGVANMESLRSVFLESEVSLARADESLGDAVGALGEAERTVLRETTASLHEVVEERARILNRIDDLVAQLERATVRAPVAGVIQHSDIRDVGETIVPGGLVFEILPSNERLVASVKLTPKDIGHVRIGDQAQLRLTTFEFRRFGGVSATIETISPTSVLDEQGNAYFDAILSLDAERVGDDDDARSIRAGMELTAEIRTSNRTLLSYLLRPIERGLSMTFSER